MLHTLALAITLTATNVAGAPRATFERAQDEVVRLFHAIGVDVTWDRRSWPTADPMIIHVVLTAYEGGVLERRPQTVMGAAIRTDGGLALAYVFYRRVEAEARQYAASEAHALACAIAHEVTHLLLPGRAHSAIGLMRACWDRDDFSRAERGQLRFSDEEAALIRARVTDGT